MASWREPVQHQPYMHQAHPHLLSVQHDHHHHNHNHHNHLQHHQHHQHHHHQLQHQRPFVPSQLDSHYVQRITFQPQLPLRSHPTYPLPTQPTYAYLPVDQFADETSSAILSETEQKAFSEFLNQLATDDILDSPATESEASSSFNPPLCDDFGPREEANKISSGYSSTSSSVQYGYPPNSLENVASNGGTANNNKRSRGLRKNAYHPGSMNAPTTHPIDDVRTNGHRAVDTSKHGARTVRRQSSLDANGHHRNSDATESYPNQFQTESIRSAPTTPPAGSPSSRPTTPTIPDSPVSTTKKKVSGTANKARTRPSKPAHELLTESEKKANHIASEQRRRQNIRTGFDSLCEIVPTLTQSHRSEALILQKSIEHIKDLVMSKNQIKERIRYLREMLGEPLEPEDNSGSDDGGPEDGDYY